MRRSSTRSNARSFRLTKGACSALPLHINDADFAQALVESWDEIAA